MRSADPIKGLVSVIIPTVTYSPFLRKAIESSLSDGYANIEVIVVFDGAPSLVEPDWLHDDHVRTFATGVRSGAGAAINLGIQHARGEFIARLDADDITLPGRFHSQVRFLEANPELLMVGTKALLIDELDTVMGEFFVQPGYDIRAGLLRTNPFVHSSIMFRHSTLLEVGGYNEQCIRMQDYELILRIAQRGEIAILPEVFVHYRVHAEQSSKKLNGFVRLMRVISSERRSLARSLGRPIWIQVGLDVVFAIAQLLRYMGLRGPRYLLGANRPAARGSNTVR